MHPVRRPLSPHLQIYRPQLTSMLSIMHRATGMALAVGNVMLVLWLLSIVMGPEWFTYYQRLWQHPVGTVILMGFSFSFFYHFLNGLRHWLWDSGRGYDLTSVYKTGYGVIIATTIATVCIWLMLWT